MTEPHPLSRSLSRAGAALLLSGAVGPSLGAQVPSFTEIPDAFTAEDVTPDGEIVVGNGSAGGYYWRWKTDPAPVSIGGLGAVAVSDDGSVIAGSMADPGSGSPVAAIWTQTGGWVPLGSFASQVTCGALSEANGISGDGSTVVGNSFGPASCGQTRAFRWTAAGGLEQLEVMGPGNASTWANAVSFDGSIVAGAAEAQVGIDPITLAPKLGYTINLWDTSGLGELVDLGNSGAARAISASGQVFLGGHQGQGFFATLIGGIVPLGQVGGGFFTGTATDYAPSAGTIIGYDSYLAAAKGWIWTGLNGIEQIKDLVKGYDIPNQPQQFHLANAISDDGLTIVGTNLIEGGWILTLPPPAQVTVYGCGVNPTGSLKHVTGLPVPGKSVTLAFDNPLGPQPPGSLVLVGFGTAPAPGFPCGLPAPGFGAGGPGAMGELLLDPYPPSVTWAQVGGVWGGPGVPYNYLLQIPWDDTLAGYRLYLQGVIWDWQHVSASEFALTDAAEIRIGP